MFRIKFVYDHEAVFEECNGENRPLTAEEYRDNPYRNTSYKQYLAYYGNPDRHVYLGAVCETQCSCCGEWRVRSAVWGLDYMDDDRDLLAVCVDRWYDESEIPNLHGSFKEAAEELLAEAA